MGRLDPGALRLYVVTAGGMVPGRTHLDVALAAIEGGASALQLRAPELPDEELLRLASRIAPRCRQAGVLFIVNDRVAVAAASGAGTHVGQDEDPGAARAWLGAEPVLGVSVSTLEQARSAKAAGADYLGVTVWATPTKPEAVPLGLGGLRAIASSTSLPVVGIGGIDAGNAADVLASGAAGVAVVSAVSAAPDPVRATRTLAVAMREGKVEKGR
ncbi:MAG TPA: thiamine phosphate synthase [Actinomycetota bacterium]|jgi:thiamine-phosphate pyrophosphorylase|nr:thiamine phosphate synthase [Actinomycetota bacterium]